MYTPRRGLGNSSSRLCRSLSAISASIVKRLASRALTGNCLHLSIQQHLGYSVHVTWRIDTDVTMSYHSAADRCFARCFDTQGMWRILQGVETEPYRRSMWLYGLYGIHVAAATSLKQDTSLPSLSPTLSGNYEQTPVEATGVGEWWPLQMPLSYIIYCVGVRRLVLTNFNTECALFIQPLYYITVTFYLLLISLPSLLSSAILWFILHPYPC